MKRRATPPALKHKPAAGMPRRWRKAAGDAKLQGFVWSSYFPYPSNRFDWMRPTERELGFAGRTPQKPLVNGFNKSHESSTVAPRPVNRKIDSQGLRL